MTEADKILKKAERQAKKDRKKAYKEQLEQYKTPLTTKEKVVRAISIVLAVITVLVFGGQFAVNALNKAGCVPFVMLEAKLVLKNAPEYMDLSYGNAGKKRTYIELNENYAKDKKAEKNKSKKKENSKAIEEALNVDVMSALQIYYYEGNEKVVVTDKKFNSLIVLINKSAFLVKAAEKTKSLTNVFNKIKIALVIIDVIVGIYAWYLIWGRKYDMRIAMEKDINSKSLQKRTGVSEEEAKKTSYNNVKKKKKKKK